VTEPLELADERPLVFAAEEPVAAEVLAGLALLEDPRLDDATAPLHPEAERRSTLSAR